MTIETVVFDFGQVLVGWDPRRVWADSLTPEQAEALLEEVDFAVVNRQLDAGARWADLRPEVERKLGERVAHLDTYLRDYHRSLTGPIPGMSELVEDVRRAGLRTVGLTNWSAETFHHAPAAAPVIGTITEVLVSGREGVAKPDPAIFALTETRFELDPARTAFLDDSAANVRAAQEAGWQAHLFTDSAGARSWLTALGIPLPPV
ncbi:HAD family hydrolase [Ruania zhangjianzhongii]|uniref:HAD family hydrolase n=1 Tax=Ruania zhangjianzhongii TaxID=2603206 RepID=UPI0011C6FE0A|nr:HAD family phosphatase [Ruania zhangjianzhongii]